MKAYFNAMTNYASFAGRATRSQFWVFMLVVCVLLVIGTAFDIGLQLASERGEVGPIAGIITLIHLLPILAIQARRLHDIDKSGWWILINIVPLGFIVLLVLYVTASSPGANSFGPRTGQVGATTGAIVAPAVVLSSGTTMERLERLANLKASGALDEGEFMKMKSEILSQTR